MGELSTAISTEELRACEAFITAFYNALDDGETGLSGPELLTAQIHIDTIDLQMRAPEPSRGVIKAAVSDLGTFLMGATSGVAASYLYALLPHLH
jgi:hypothetical protein